MAMTFEEAYVTEVTRRACSFKTEWPSTEPPEGVNCTHEEWCQLSPGYRDAIIRDLDRQNAKLKPPPTESHDLSDDDKRMAVERRAEALQTGEDYAP